MEVRQERRESKCQVVRIMDWPRLYRNTACPMGHLWRRSVESLHLRTVCSEVGRASPLSASSLLPPVFY